MKWVGSSMSKSDLPTRNMSTDFRQIAHIYTKGQTAENKLPKIFGNYFTFLGTKYGFLIEKMNSLKLVSEWL